MSYIYFFIDKTKYLFEFEEYEDDLFKNIRKYEKNDKYLISIFLKTHIDKEIFIILCNKIITFFKIGYINIFYKCNKNEKYLYSNVKKINSNSDVKYNFIDD